MGKNIIWTNDSPNRDAVEKYFKDDWINEVRAQFGLEASNESWIPSGLFDAVKEAAIDSAIEKAVDRNEETINFVQAYRDFAQEESIGEIIDEQFGEQLAERVDEDISNWRGDEVLNLSDIDVSKSIPFIKDGGDGYCSLEDFNRYQFTDDIATAGDLIEALYEKMNGDTIELSIKDGDLVVSESVGYVGEMEDHIVKLVDTDFVNEMECLSSEEVDKLYGEHGFGKNTALEDAIVALAEEHGRTQDVASAICEVYGWKTGVEESQEAVESLDEIYDVKSAEAEFGQEDHAEISGEQVRG